MSVRDLEAALTAGARPVSDPEFAALIEPLGPFGERPRIVVGVSGGPHSLALAVLAQRWTAARGGSVIGGVCDHGLRAESADEARAVVTALGERGIAARVVALGVGPGAAVQARARAARMAALLSLCSAEGAPWLLLGHHRGDQAETLLLRALAGSGTTGLAGMAAARAAGAALVLRPLLGVAPARLEAVVAAAGLTAWRDPSNEDRRFARARMRAVLGDPAGEGAAVQALATAAAGFAARRGAAEGEAARRIAVAVALHEAGFARIDRAALGADAVARAALGALVRVIGGAEFAPAELAVGRLLGAGQGTLGGAVLRRDGLLLREAAVVAGPVPAVAGARWDGRFALVGAAEPGLFVGAAGEAARRLPRPAGIPAAVVPTLPALYRDGVLAVVPALAYRCLHLAGGAAFLFAPEAGPVV